MRGGYTHGKRSKSAPPRPLHIEDRIARLEQIVAGLMKLFGNSLAREQAAVQRESTALDLEFKSYRDNKKKAALKKPIKKKRPPRGRS